jgi:cytochrome c oxidase subunit 3
MAYGFSDLNLLKHGHWLMSVYTLPFMHGVSVYVLCSINDFYFDFSSVTMVLAVDAGHQMKKNKVVLYMFLTIMVV